MPPAANGAKVRIRRLLERLPSPRDEQAIALARSVKGLAKGTPVPQAKTTTPASRRAAERWLRDVPPATTEPQPAQDPEGSDLGERAAVRAGWQLVDVYERLSTAAAERVFGDELQAWYDYARQTVPNLRPWGTPGGLKLYERDHNRLRFRRTMDFVREGERVFDVGFGRGYLAGLLLRERKLAGYHGIDILPANLTATRQMMDANGLQNAEVGVAMGDIYDLTGDQVAATGANLVICCEVLEHVPDAELALRKLADALPEGADLLFSVPLYGRLEHVWGHVSVFDTARLKAMLQAAGLVAHHVEPLANIWTIVVASRSPEPSVRVREASGRPPVNVSRPLSARRDFVDVPAADMTVGGVAGATCDLTQTEKFQSTCVLSTSAGSGSGSQAAVSFPVQGLEAMRLMLKPLDFEHVTNVRVQVRRGGEQVGEWSWTPKKRHATGAARRFALRPGESSASGFRTGEFADLTGADRVEVVVTVRPEQSAKFAMQAAYLPGPVR